MQVNAVPRKFVIIRFKDCTSVFNFFASFVWCYL